MSQNQKLRKMKILLGVLATCNLILLPTTTKASEADFLKGVMGAIIVNGIIQEVKKDKQPVIYRKQVNYVNPYRPNVNIHNQNQKLPIIYKTIPHTAFNSQLPSVKYNIQGKLMKMGYYNGRLDGFWGQKTEQAISLYAADHQSLHLLTSRKGVNSLFHELLYQPLVVKSEKSNSYRSNDEGHQEILHIKLQITKLLKEISHLETQLSQLEED